MRLTRLLGSLCIVASLLAGPAVAKSRIKDIVEFEGALPGGIVPLFDAFLGAFDGAVQPWVLQFLTVFEAHLFH